VPCRGRRRKCFGSSRGWCGMPMARVFGSKTGRCLAGRAQSRTQARGRTSCSPCLMAGTWPSRVVGCSRTASSQLTLVWMATSYRSRPTGRIQSSRWRHRFACRNPGRIGVPNRKTWRRSVLYVCAVSFRAVSCSVCQTRGIPQKRGMYESLLAWL
jgi:hypothetical protein